MQFTKNILFIFLTIHFVSIIETKAQASSNSGTILNMGVINIKNGALNNDVNGLIQNSLGKDTLGGKNIGAGRINISDQTVLQSNGKIENDGTIYSLGYLNFVQKSINGDVIYENKGSDNKPIENASYFNVKFFGDGKKIPNRDEQFEIRNSFYSDPSSVLEWDPGRKNIQFIIKDSVDHNGNLNPNYYGSKFLMNQGAVAQKVMGTGAANILELSNSLGADILDTTANNANKDGLKINHLILTNGELRNSASANITIGGSAIMGNSTTLSFATGTITRTNLGSLKSEPNMPTKVDLQYVGNTTDPIIATSGEIPKVQTSQINDLHVDNESGVMLTNSATVTNKIIVKSSLYTYQRDADTVINEKELVYNSQVDPEYLKDTSEVHGRMTRINFNSTDTTKSILFNNKYTSARFLNNLNNGNIKRLSFNIKPGVPYTDINQRGSLKIQRRIEIAADSVTDGSNNKNYELSTGILTAKIGWRHNDPATAQVNLNELPDVLELKKEKLIFQQWQQSVVWRDNKSSKNLNNQISANWGQIEADLGFGTTLGEFSVGAPAQSYLEMMAKVIMEGPFKYGSLANDVMFTDLRDSNMVPLTPPNIYPYTLDSNRALNYVTAIPKNIVDWVVVEFRNQAINATERHFRTCFLRKDGRLVDLDGVSDVELSQQKTSNLDTTGNTQYYVAIRHRNHLTVMSEKSIQLSLDSQTTIFDFSSPSFVYGGQNSLKLAGFDKNTNKVFSMIAGNYLTDDPNKYSRKNYLLGTDSLGVDLGMDMISDFDKDAVIDFMSGGEYSQGYLNMDFNLDGIITTKDFNIAWNNRNRLGVIK